MRNIAVSSLRRTYCLHHWIIILIPLREKMFFRCDGEDMSLISIYNKNKKRRAKSKYLLSVMVDVVKDRDIIPAKVVYVRNRNKRKESLCLISTDVNAKATLT